MDKKVKSNRFIIIVVIILLIIIGVSAYKAYQIHIERQYRVVDQKIIDAARNCYIQKECEGQITLSVLYEKTDLEELYDPVTTENIDENLCINYIDNEIVFC